MDFAEHILPFIFLIFWVVAALAGKKKRQRRTASREKPKRAERRPSSTPAREKKQGPNEAPGRSILESLRGNFEELAREIKSGIENDLPGREVGKDRAMLRQKTAGRRREHRRERDTDVSQILAPERDTGMRRRFPPPPAPARYAPKQWGRPSRQELRKAIVWSEILGPPIALREKTSGGHTL